MRWIWLLCSSAYFYAAFIPIYLLALLALIANDYYCALRIETATGAARLRWLLVSLFGNIGLLVFFKYRLFVEANLSTLASAIGWNYSISTLAFALPIGLSFHTFQSIAYTVEVYRGRVPAERHLGLLALYVLFYPQLVAGPIERPENMLHQFRDHHSFDYRRVTDGLKLMCWGLFKKMVIADRLALHVNRVYSEPTQFDGLGLCVATVFFAFQIYCDFSGYSDIALGSAQVMGFQLMTNFRRPYWAQSISDFWRRWHISLSTWFRDYVYIPLGGARAGRVRWQLNLLTTFLLSGLWHGANWTFVAWGALHGVYLIASIWLGQAYQLLATRSAMLRRLSAPAWAKMALVFVLTAFAWIFFRADTLSDARYIATHLASGFGALLGDSAERVALLRRNLPLRNDLVVITIALGILLAVERCQQEESVRQMLARQPTWLRWSLYYGSVITILAFGVFEQSQFIYFQF